jgi:hypothetical protein
MQFAPFWEQVSAACQESSPKVVLPPTFKPTGIRGLGVIPGEVIFFGENPILSCPPFLIQAEDGKMKQSSELKDDKSKHK